jgi:hypothetical protein
MRLPVPLQALQRLCRLRLNLQRGVPKWPNHAVLLLLFIPLVPSCLPPGEPAREPAPENSGSWSGSEAAAYRSGHSDGSRDKRRGRPHAPRSEAREHSSRGEYLRGYEDGFRNPNDNPWSQHRAYELGMQQGRRDKLAGLSMDPGRRSAQEVPQAVREHFRSGYREGWQSAQ